MIPLVSRELTSDTLNGLLWEDRDMAVWWGTWPECAVAIRRLEREGNLDPASARESRAALDSLTASWFEVQPTEDIRLSVSLLAQNHPLKASDALQLAAALRWCEGDTEGAGFVCLDNRLRRAAEDEGFYVLLGDEQL